MKARVINDNFSSDTRKLLDSIGVTTQGVSLMLSKTKLRLILLSDLSPYVALVLKQEMLSIGGDLATPKETLTGKKKKLTCLLMATNKQLMQVYKKLAIQSVSLRQLMELLKLVIANHDKKKYKIRARDKTINVSKPLIMGIFNLTTDSFSGDSLLISNQKLEIRNVLALAKTMVETGVDIFDIGGESTKPFAKKISAKEELSRVIPVIKLLNKNFPKIPISIDTYKPEVAEKALRAGAVMINDITGMRSPKMVELAAKTGAAVCLMHMQGTPQNMQTNPKYKDVVSEVYDFFIKRTTKIIEMGIAPEQIVLDVGIGFGKRLEDNLTLIKHHKTFKSLGFPMLLGVSRKSFIGSVLNKKDPSQRVLGTVIANAVGLNNGASILRVHDVEEAKQTINMLKALNDVD